LWPDVSPAGSPATDAALVGRVAGGDLGALGELYDRHSRSLLGFVRRQAPREDAEDVVQNVFLRVVGAAEHFEARAGAARPWLFGIAVRLLQERRRSLRRLAATLAALAHRPRVAPDTSQRPELQRALGALTDAKRVVLLLAEVEGFTCEEISSMLGVPVGTVWTRLHHARRELRAHFGESP
jgi:RNA polymerase sigma-70 factor (ECF subfamily)